MSVNYALIFSVASCVPHIKTLRLMNQDSVSSRPGDVIVKTDKN